MEAPDKREREEVVVYEDSGSTPGWVRTWVCSKYPITFHPDLQPDFLPLVQEWQGFSFAHPPHDEAQLWCEKAVTEASKLHYSVLLLPAVFNSIYWRTVIYPGATEIHILTCPVKKPGAKKQIVSQMALVIFAGREGMQEGLPPPLFLTEPENWELNYYKRQRNFARFAVRK